MHVREAGQLIREDILEDDKTVIYTYDVGGNIVSKNEHAYTLSEIAEENKTVKTAIYKYADSVWGDLLTGFTYTDTDSKSDSVDTEITYDESGNVTCYNGVSYTWRGKKLASAVTADGEYVEYFYNLDGYLTRLDVYETDEETGKYIDLL